MNFKSPALVSALSILAVAGMVGGYMLVAANQAVPGGGESLAGDLHRTLEDADAVVQVSVVERVGQSDEGVTYAGQVSRVEPLAAREKLRPGRVGTFEFFVRDGVGDFLDNVTARLDAGGPAILMLIERTNADGTSYWELMSTFDPGAHEFDGVSGAGGPAAQFAVVSPGLNADVLFEWKKEIAGDLPAGGPLPISAAWKANSARDRVSERWNELDPRDRSLDAELSPADVLETLVSQGIYLDVPAIAFAGDGEEETAAVEIRSDVGVVYSFLTAVGPHSATVLTPPDAQWQVVLTYGEDREGIVLGVLDATDWSASEVAALHVRVDVVRAGVAALQSGEHTLPSSDSDGAPRVGLDSMTWLDIVAIEEQRLGSTR